MTMSGLAANRSPWMVAPRLPKITYSEFYKGGRGARSDSKAADWNYGTLGLNLRWMWQLLDWIFWRSAPPKGGRGHPLTVCHYSKDHFVV